MVLITCGMMSSVEKKIEISVKSIAWVTIFILWLKVHEQGMDNVAKIYIGHFLFL